MTPITLDQIQTFLRRIQHETGQYAVVAGGSVRDTMLGRPVKDIANKTITWVKGTRPLEDRERRHLERIRAKYPGWKVRRVQWRQAS